MARRPASSLSGMGSSHERRRIRGRMATGVPSLPAASSAQSGIHILGAADADGARSHHSAVAAVIAEVPEAAEVPAPPVFGPTPPLSILENLRTRGFHPNTPFFATAARGAQFIRGALTESDREALREFSSGMLTGHFWRDSSRAIAFGYEMTQRLVRLQKTERRLRRDIGRSFEELENLRAKLRKEKRRSRVLRNRLHKEAADRWCEGLAACQTVVQRQCPHMDFSTVHRLGGAFAAEKEKNDPLDFDGDEEDDPIDVEPFCRRAYWGRGPSSPPPPPPPETLS
ncbi:hypothetical protein U1Q18_024896 [Sarracenia purpurea var. burkii]